nr:unnamed protein product [Digitaria exilis]
MPPPPLLPRLSLSPPPLGARDALPSRGRRRRAALPGVVRAKGKDEASFTDRILDYIEGGPKLRRWYGAPELLPKDGVAEDVEDESPDIEEPRDAVLVTDGDSEIGQVAFYLLFFLLLQNCQCTDVNRCMVGDMEDKSFSKKALKGVRAVICPADDGFFSEPVDLKGVEHIILLSQLAVYRSSGGLQAIMNSKLKKLAERDEEVVLASGIPSTIIRTGSLQSTPGGERGFDFTEGVAAKGRISKEDAATICVEALDIIPRKTLIFEVANGDEKVSDWKAWFAEQTKEDVQIQ